MAGTTAFNVVGELADSDEHLQFELRDFQVLDRVLASDSGRIFVRSVGQVSRNCKGVFITRRNFTPFGPHEPQGGTFCEDG